MMAARTWYAQPVADPGRLVMKVTAIGGESTNPVFNRQLSDKGIEHDTFVSSEPWGITPRMTWNELLNWAYPGGIQEVL